MCPPQHHAPVPSLAALCCLTLGAVLLPLCFLPSAVPPPPQPASAPSLLLPSVQPRQPNPQAASTARRAPAPRWYCCSTDVCSPQKSCCGGGCSLSPVRGCPVPRGAAGACIFRLYPPARLCLRRQLPQELTHFRLRQGRGCPVPLARQLAPAIHSSLMFNVKYIMKCSCALLLESIRGAAQDNFVV